MAAASPFPPVDTTAIASAASDLTAISAQMSDTGTQVSVLRDAVAGTEQWQGSASGKWQTVVTGRVSDASLSSEVVSKAASLLQQLGADLETEESYYNKVSAELQDKAASANPRFNPLPSGFEDPYITAMNGATTRATSLLNNAGNDFLALAALADGITATGAANRMPGTPAGAKAPSLAVLATVLGSVTAADKEEGFAFQRTVLKELNLTENTTRFAPYGTGGRLAGRDLTSAGLARGTTPDAIGDNYIVEVKNTVGVSLSAQIRAQLRLASDTESPLWVVVSPKTQVGPPALQAIQQTGGGVVVRTGENTFTEYGSGQPVTPVRLTQGGADSFMFVRAPSADVASGPADPGAPAVPVDTATGPTAPAPGPADPPVGPGDDDPIGSIDPIDLP